MPLELVPIESPIAGWHIADLGVVDANDDGNLDLFTSNHEFPARLYLSDGAGGFEDVTRAWSLGIDPSLPGLEASLAVQPAAQEGTHVYFEGRELLVRARGLRASEPIRGRLQFEKPVEVEVQGSIDIVRDHPARPRMRSVAFEARGTGLLRVKPWFPANRIMLILAPETPLERVFLGQYAIAATSLETQLFQVDRHGLAWADFDGDGDRDVFISRGGALGLAPGFLQDELLVNQGGRLRNRASEYGLRKQRGRGRRVEWVDFDGDGLLDLYIGNLESRNQLWAQRSDGVFQDVAPRLGLDIVQGDVFRWIDVDEDGDLDLVTPGREAVLRIFERVADGFLPRGVEGCFNRDPRQMALADFDLDGDMDIFVADAAGDTLFSAHGGSYRPVDLDALGLRTSSLAANWVDVDNDGRPELHLVPGGLQRLGREGLFEAVGIEIAPPPRDARCGWLDLDGDGDRDGLCELRLGLFPVQHVAYRNDTRAGNWLAIDLVGEPGNRHAIGARLQAEVGQSRTAHMVAESEGAHLSQGHYRVYLGLGAHAFVDRLEVIWPDGARSEHRLLRANQVVRIERSSASLRAGRSR